MRHQRAPGACRPDRGGRRQAHAAGRRSPRLAAEPESSRVRGARAARRSAQPHVKPTNARSRPRPAWWIAAFVLMSSAARAAPVVRSADLKITVTSPTSCDVTMVVAIDGGADIDHRIEAFEGSHVELAAMRGARHVGGIQTIGRTQSLVL